MKDVNCISQKENSFQMLEDAPSSFSETYGPQRQESRRRTDTLFLIFFIFCIILLVPLLVYTLSYSDVNRHRGYDSCGNICGQINVKYAQWNCTGRDMTSKPVLFETKGCDRVTTFSHILYAMFSPTEEISVFASIVATKLALASVIVLAVHVILFVLFRYTTAAVVCIILMASYIYYPSVALVLWLLYDNCISKIIFVTITIIILLCTLIFNRNQVRMVTVLLVAAVKAIFDMKKIFLITISVLFILIAILVAYSVSSFHIETAGILTEQESAHLDYVSDSYMEAAKYLNFAVALWAIQFIVAIEFMTVSGAITKWYFFRKHTGIKDVVLNSLYVVLKNHLGTAAVGSFLLTLVTPVRFVLKCLSQISIFKELTGYFLVYLDGFFSDDVYIMTAVYGTSYLQSGKNVVKFRKLNIGKTNTINYFGDLVVVSAQILLILLSFWPTLFLTVGEIYSILHYPYLFLFEFGFSFICGQAILGPIRIASNTIFFCAHQDCLEENDFDNQPYVMTHKRFVDGSNLLFVQTIQEKCLKNV